MNHRKKSIELLKINQELAFQNKEKEERAAELIIANKELIYQNEEKEKRAAELIIANKELIYQNEEKEKRAAELLIANKELIFQHEEKEKRAAELILLNAEINKAKEKFRLVVESAPTAMVLINHEDLITLVNNQTEKLFGYERDELVGNKLKILIPEKFLDQHADYRKIVLKNNDNDTDLSNNELLALRKNGIELQVQLSLNPISTDEGPMVLVSIIDLTSSKIQEATMKRQLELEIKNKELEQFAYIASHDLQEPLRTVANYIKVFEEDYVDCLDKNAVKYLFSINNAIKRMSNLIKSLLDYSRLGHNAKLIKVDFQKLLAEVQFDLKNLIENSNTIIEISELPKLFVYEIEMRQVFQNLITNAIKFRRKDVQSKIQISALLINNIWKFSITDNGIGIEPEHFNHIFDLFKRLNQEKEYEGQGIGLANCKKIIQMHHGDIWVDSKLNEKTTFYFTLPILTI